MKKFLLLFLGIFFVSGCGKNNNEDIVKDFISKVENSKGYLVESNMEIISDEDTFKYNITASFKENDYYRVSLVNTINNHEQIILKNDNGVYVITPSLNKSFKFQSDWPKNSSQAYLISSLVNDLNNDPERTITKSGNEYIVKVKANYVNNPKLAYQLIYFDKDGELKKVEVCNNEDVKKIIVTYNRVDYKSTFSDNYFELDEIITENNEEKPKEKETINIIDDIIYPLYIPNDTYLSSKDVINSDNNERVILSFTGNKSFVLVEEVSSFSDEFEVIPVYGEPVILNDTYGAISGTSLTWTSNNIDYYLSSDNLTQEEMMMVATSLSNSLSVYKEGK